MKSKHIIVTSSLMLAFRLANAESVTYSIEPTHTLPRVEYSHMGYSTQSSRFDKVSGIVKIDRDAHSGSADIVIDASSIDTGVALLNTNIQGKDLLDVSNHPTIEFKSNHFIFRGDTLISVAGDLSIRGITRPVELEVQSFICKPHPRAKVEACGAVATATIKRTDYGVSAFVPLVSDDLKLIIPVEAIRQP